MGQSLIQLYKKVLNEFHKYPPDKESSELELIIFTYFDRISEMTKKAIVKNIPPKKYYNFFFIYSEMALNTFSYLDPSIEGVSGNYKLSDNYKTVPISILNSYLKVMNDSNDIKELYINTQQFIKKLADSSLQKLDLQTITNYHINPVTDVLDLEKGKRLLNTILNSEKINDFKYPWDEIIGNEEAKEELKKISRMLFTYDLERHANPWVNFNALPKSILLEGPPGTGKTSLINALISEMKYLSEKSDKPFNFYMIDNTIKSKYYSESVKKLSDLLKTSNDFNRISLVIIEDIDTVFSSRNDDYLYFEEANLLNYLMNFLEGVGQNWRGNVLYVSTTNNVTKIDDALLSRLIQKRLKILGPQTPKEYKELIKRKLNKVYELGLVELNENELETLSKFFYNYKISARDVTNYLISKINESINTNNIEEYITKDYDNALNSLKKDFKKITYERLYNGLKEYFSKENYISKNREINFEEL